MTPDPRELVRTPFLSSSPLDTYCDIENVRTLRLNDAMLVSEGDGGAETNFAAVFGPMQADEFLRAAREFFGNEQYAVVIESETASILEEHLVAEAGRWTRKRSR
ncbi:MAG: hypothetical protein R2849_14940 [Thermomicrobiales bacterium]